MWLILMLLIIGGGVYMIMLYNRLRGLSEGVKRAQSNLVGELRKRATLVNQLIDVCQGYGDHEKLAHLTIAGAGNESNAAELASATSTVLASVGMMANRFPDLKANQTYNTLMAQLETIENQLQAKRELMNKEVEGYNRVRSGFPAVLVATQLGFPEAAYFSTDEAGLDQSQHFRTDDGEMLKAQFAKIGQGVGAATRQFGQRANAALQQTRAAGDQAAGEEAVVTIVEPGAGEPGVAPTSQS